MARDYGVRARGGTPALTVAAALAVAAGAGLLVANAVRDDRKAHEAERRAAAYWTVTGPPCRLLQPAEIAASAVRLRRALDMGGVQFLRAYGDVHCRPFETGVRDQVGGDLVCQFTGPSRLRVATASGTYDFDTGPGAATVAVKDEVPACVLAGHFKPGQPAPEG